VSINIGVHERAHESCGVTPPSFETRLSGAPQDEGFWGLSRVTYETLTLKTLC
jgi:hypothetical protein